MILLKDSISEISLLQSVDAIDLIGGIRTIGY
jgi:hypothetical protein